MWICNVILITQQWKGSSVCFSRIQQTLPARRIGYQRSVIEGWSEGERVVGKGARAPGMAAALRRLPVISGLRPESDWLANTWTQRKRIWGGGGRDAERKAAIRAGRASITVQMCHRLTVSRPRCTRAIIQTGASETPAVLDFQHSHQNVLKEDKKNQVAKPQVLSVCHGCRNAKSCTV